MDILTQALAGGVLASAAGRVSGVSGATLRWAAALGAVAALLPDLDVLIRSDADPLLQIEYHRHFSHALLTAPCGGLLVAALFKLALRAPLSWAAAVATAALGWLSAGLLDACTSYGTHLLWPFSDRRVAGNMIAIVDPLFSALLLSGLLLAWRRRRARPAAIALALACLYLALGAAQRERGEALVERLAAARGHRIDGAAVVKPTLGNLLLWRSVYRAGDQYLIDALWLGRQPLRLSGSRAAAFELSDDFPTLSDKPDSVLYRDVTRFARVSDGFLVRHPHHRRVVGDIRYALLADSAAPLWGIEVDPAAPQRHAPLRRFRDFDRDDRRHFLTLLRGATPPPRFTSGSGDYPSGRPADTAPGS